MKISLDWISDFIELQEHDPQKIADRVTVCVAEVDEVQVQGEMLMNCCVGKVLSLTKHPNADKLSLCEVQTDRGKKNIVCGGTNLRVGMRVAFAHIGARVRWHGTEMMTLEKTKIRGEESEGMICGADELDLSAQFPQSRDSIIIDMGDSDKDIGKPLREYLGLTDTVLHIDNHAITHRADLFSHIGFAREFVAIGLGKWKKKSTRKAPGFSKTALPFSFVNDVKELVPRYCACIINLNSLGETPEWMRRRLTATGWRCVNLPVDITNYVAMETGMPLHSFDADDLRGDVRVRLSKEGESIQTLDEVKRTLPKGALVLSDDLGIFDLLGIMGGLRSSTKESTKRVYLHSVAVDPVSIRKTIIATGHRTDAGTVYEKGIPRIAVEQGFMRALELFLELSPGASVGSKMETWGTNGAAKPIPLSPDRVSSVLGTDVPAKTITKILGDLEFKVTKKGKSELAVTPPLHRLGDIRGEHDLIEEIARVIGYNEIPPVPARATIDPPKRDERIGLLREALKEEGFIEILPIALVGPSLLRKCEMDPGEAIVIGDPLGEELSLFQTSTVPGLLEQAQSNMLNVGLGMHESQLRTFHWGNVHRKTTGEFLEMSLLLANLGAKQEDSLLDDPFLLLKQDLEYMLSSLGVKVTLSQDTKPSALAHPGRAAVISIGKNVIGTLCEIHPRVRERFDLPKRASVATLNLSALLALPNSVRIAVALPAFPAITYDMNIELSAKNHLAPLVEKLRTLSPLIESIQVVDIYSKSPIANREYRVTLRFTFRAADRTLTENDAQDIEKKVSAFLKGSPVGSQNRDVASA